MQSKPPSSKNLQRLDKISARGASRSQMRGAEVARLVSVFQEADVPQQTLPWYWHYCGVCCDWLLMAHLAQDYKFFFACIQTRMRKFVQPSELSTNQNLNGYGTQLM